MVPSRGKVIICGYYDETYFQSRYKWKETKYMDEFDMSPMVPAVTRFMANGSCQKGVQFEK